MAAAGMTDSTGGRTCSTGLRKSEGKVEPAAEEKQVEAPAQNVVEAVPASESDKSTGELKKQKPKKEDSDGDAPNETAQEEQEAPIEQEKIVLFYTCGYLPHVIALEEYEKMQEKKKSQEASKPEERRAAAVDFEGLQLLEKKKIEHDAKLKAENVRKAKEAAAKEAKPLKAISIQEYLKPEDGSEGSGRYQERQDGYNGERWDQQGGYYQERRDACNGDRREQGRYNGGGRGNGGYQERRDAYNGNRQEQGRYNGGRGNGYQQHQDGYNGYRGGYYNSGRGNGGYHQGGNYRQRQAPKPKEEDKVVITEADFPALGGASQAQSQA
ncbi:hypothetical protein VPH35_053006 [Triticum aestivum]